MMYEINQINQKEDNKMSISWDVKITQVNLNSKRGTVVATRTDDQSASPPRVHVLSNTPLETAYNRTKVLDTIKEWDEAVVANAAAAEVFIDSLDQIGKTDLETWELTR